MDNRTGHSRALKVIDSLNGKKELPLTEFVNVISKVISFRKPTIGYYIKIMQLWNMIKIEDNVVYVLDEGEKNTGDILELFKA